ncbi:hybrid sensor histidine kinase/response regulator transcription factor [Maribacter polysaccharolyticus]|uniref:hybrid sensor histidine kinase/response regulator transcription factor n=1 Tax=Maribacter polysaccharolyticus TaxID=3020831 RepID=UPI00237FA381|nr:two-component regulator propeller domain-containing protein [Maribacter polysaccharolyticus]MDE3742670.1 two-component regulator propeller domain-containing protein [Maribacter polysaccharolyticus]
MQTVTRLATCILFLHLMLLSGSNSFLANAQNFDRFSNKEGFNQNTINTIAQDKYGFLWFGTPNGLIKYDGYEFETYTTQSKTNGSISSNNLTSLHSDYNGVLWIGTNVGMNLYIPWLETFYTVPLPSKLEVTHITSGSNGDLWFSGENQLYHCILKSAENGVLNVSKNLLKGYPNITSINDFGFIGDDELIVATTSGLKKIELDRDSLGQNPKIKTLVDLEKFKNTNITVIKSINNIFWIGTENGLFKTTLEENRVHVIKNIDHIGTAKTQIHPLHINTIFEDINGDVWIGTVNTGLLKYLEKEDRFLNYRYSPKNNLGLSSNYINAVFQDNYGVLWIGTAQGGINKLDISQKQFINYSKNPYDGDAITDNLITSILEDNKGRLWVSVYNNNDLLRSTTKVSDTTVFNLKFENLKNKIPFPVNKTIRCIYEDKKGFIWFGTESNLFVYEPSSKRFKKVALKKDGKTLPDQVYRDILQIDEANFILVGSEITVIETPWSKIQKGSLPELDVKSFIDLQERDICHTLLKHTNNTVWFGTNKGLLYGTFDGGKITIDGRLSDEKNSALKLSYSNVFSLHEDQKGHIWSGTFGGGLNKITVNHSGSPIIIDCYRKNDVLPDDAIYGILPEGETYLWISTDMGLVKFNTETNETDVFDVRDGLAQNNFRHGAYFKGESGYYYFGGLNGLTIFKPENIKQNTVPPKIQITSLLVNNKEVKIGEKFNNKTILEKSISETESIAVSQNEQSIAFQLVVEHTSTPAKNKLAYKLEGFNGTWIASESGKSTVTYTNLSAGEYTFKVKAANGDGVWSPEIKNLKVRILPPWYQTWWSYLIFIVLILLICAGVMIYFIQHEKLKQKLNYEQLDKERMDIINQGKFRYFTNVSHEFRTPLTLIAGPLEQIIETNKDETQSKYLAIIQKNTKRLLSLADQLITFRQAEQGFVSLNLNKITLGNFIYPTTEAFENYAIEKDINFFYKVGSPNEEIVIDVQKVERILFNLLSNAFKNTPSHGNISIEADIIHKENDTLIKIDVVDTGKGIPAKDLNNIFERFYQLGNKKENISGGGIGLAFCKSLVALFKGEITVKSEPNVETRFSVLIPSIPNNDYDSSEIDTANKSYIKDWVPLPSEYKTDQIDQKKDDDKPKYTILIVEDEEDLQIFLRSYLSDGYNILMAKNGLEGLEKIKAQEPDLVISDIMMPKMDGFALCENIKSNPETCHIPVLLLTALEDDENLIKGLELGADEYMSKPFSLKHLALRAKKLIQNNLKLKEHFAKNSSLPNGDIEISTRDKEFLNDIINVIDKNISDSSFGVEELSTAMGLSTSHFYRRLKQLTGQVPNVYLRNYRLQRAAELLKSNEGFNVTEVIYQIGIESPSYFSTSFKKLYGVSPSEFLKK